MFISNGFSVTIVGLILVICVEKLTAVNRRLNSSHEPSKITSDRLKSDSEINADLDKTFNTFKRKDRIGQKTKKSSKKTIKLDNDEARRTIKQSEEKREHENRLLSNTSETSDENTKRQSIFGVPSAISAADLMPRRFVAYPKFGFHTGYIIVVLILNCSVCEFIRILRKRISTLVGQVSSSIDSYLVTCGQFRRRTQMFEPAPFISKIGVLFR